MVNVAIDGPAGAGKSTIARRAARELGYIYIDTGALYRTVGLAALRAGKDLDDMGAVASVLTDELSVRLEFVGGGQHMFLNGEDVSEQIRTPEVSAAASKVSAVPQVRAYLFDLQRKLAAENNCVMDGRDIGTVVLPNAQVKIFLTASPEIRARRRFDELKEKGMDVKYDDVLTDMLERDHNDTHRKIAPLKQASDAVLCDTSELDLEQSVQRVLEIVRGSR